MLALLLAVPAAASAESIVYVKGGLVWVANADNSGARVFTPAPNGWRSPSEADDGTVVVAGGLPRINPGGTDSSGGSELYRFSPNGTQIGGPITTYASYSMPSCPTYGPDQVRVSPDASKIAYSIVVCGDVSQTALWSPATATGLSFPSQSKGQKDFEFPAWIDSSRFVVGHRDRTTGEAVVDDLVPRESGGGRRGPPLPARPPSPVRARRGTDRPCRCVTTVRVVDRRDAVTRRSSVPELIQCDRVVAKSVRQPGYRASVRAAARDLAGAGRRRPAPRTWWRPR